MAADQGGFFDDDVLREQRERMVSTQLAARDIVDERVLEAMRTIPRHLFVASQYHGQAYMDSPLPIEQGQTISQPYIVALMTQVLHLMGDETVLEVGTGSGYQAAVLARLAKWVYTIELHPDLAEKARLHLAALGYSNVTVVTGDGSSGLLQHAPYQAIVVTAAAPEVPKPLLDQLADEGRLIIPIGRRWEQTLFLYTRHKTSIQIQAVTPVIFVPLRGKHGWETYAWPGEMEA